MAKQRGHTIIHRALSLTLTLGNQVLWHAISACEKRGEAAAAVEVVAKAAAKASADAHTDRASLSTAARVTQAAEKTNIREKREKSKRKNAKFIDTATREARAKECTPKRLPIGMIDLSNTKPLSKSALATECKLRDNACKLTADSKVKELVSWLSKFHEGAMLIPQMTDFGGEKIKAWRSPGPARVAADLTPLPLSPLT